MAFLISLPLALAFACLSPSLLSLCTAQDPRSQSEAPHGLPFENPIAFPPSAFEFFHPHSSPASTESPLPMSSSFPQVSSKAKADRVFTWPAPRGSDGHRAGGVVAAVLGTGFVVLLAAGASYVVFKRRAIAKRAKALVRPDA